MKKLQVLIIAFLILLSIGAFSSLQVKGQDLFVSVSPGGATLDVTQSVTFGASASGGSGTYTSYQWYVNSAPEGDGSSLLTFSADSAGSYSISVIVTDDSGTSAQSSATVTVNEDPTLTIAPAGSLTVPAGQAQTFTATVSGGSSPFYYQWYLDGSRVGSNGATYSYSAQGYSHSVTCVVTDSASTPFIFQSNAVTIMVGSGPTEAPTPFPSGILTPAPSSPMLTPAPSTAQTPLPSSPMLTPAPFSANPTFILTPAPTTSSPASVFNTIDLLIVVVVVIVVLFPILLVWQGRRRRNVGAMARNSQTPPSVLGESELINTENTIPETAAVSEEQNDWLEGSQAESSVGEFGDEEVTEIQIDPKSLAALKKHGSVYILTDIRNPQYSYRKIKGYDAKLAVEFKEFVEVRKTNVEGAQTEISTETFRVSSPIDSKQKDLGYYVGKSGFSSVEDWVKTLKIEDEIPVGETVSKVFYIYYIHTV